MFREALKWTLAGWCAVLGGQIVLILLGAMAFNFPLFMTMMMVPIITSPVGCCLR